MKKITLLLCAIASGLALIAQQNPLETYFSDLLADENNTQVMFSGKMFEMSLHIEADNEEEAEFLEAISMIDGVCLVANDEVEDTNDIFDQVRKRPRKAFENLVTISDKEGQAEVLIKEENGLVSEVLIIAAGQEGFMVVGIWGHIELNALAAIAREMQVTAMRDFDADAAGAGRDITMYPNPSADGKVSLTLPDALLGATVKVRDMSGKLLLEERVTSERIQLNTEPLKTGTYLVSVNKGSHQVFSEALIITR